MLFSDYRTCQDNNKVILIWLSSFIDINEGIGTSQECSQIFSNPIFVHVNQDITILNGMEYVKVLFM